MKALLSTRASRAWLGVALVGLVVIVLGFALGLIPRLTAGQDVIDAAKPALTDERVAGDRAGIDFISKYVDLADPLMTVRGGGSDEIATLVGLLRKRTKRSAREVAALLHREAPHTEALLRALPLSAAAREIPDLTGYLATTLNLPEEDLAAEVEQSFPKLSQTLTALPIVTSGWNDIPGTEGLTRFDGKTPVSTVPDLRDYLSGDLVATVEKDHDDVQEVASKGGIGYIPWLLLVIGVGVLAYGTLQARRAASATPPGRREWSVVVAVGVVIVGLVLVLQYFPRLNAADRAISDLQPAFAEQRVQGDRAGSDMIHQAVLLGDPIVTARGGAAAEAPRLVAFVSARTNLSHDKVRAGLLRRAPHIAALLQAIPLSEVAAEVPQLVRFLARTLRIRPDRLVATLRRRTPHLAQAILAVRPVALGWNAVPGTAKLTDFEGTTPVRTMPALDEYFSTDVIPVLETQRENFRDLADPWPPVNALAPLLLVLGVLVTLYGLLMMRVATRRQTAARAPRRAILRRMRRRGASR
jgi:hypothetical protein